MVEFFGEPGELFLITNSVECCSTIHENCVDTIIFVFTNLYNFEIEVVGVGGRVFLILGTLDCEEPVLPYADKKQCHVLGFYNDCTIVVVS